MRSNPRHSHDEPKLTGWNKLIEALAIAATLAIDTGPELAWSRGATHGATGTDLNSGRDTGETSGLAGMTVGSGRLYRPAKRLSGIAAVSLQWQARPDMSCQAVS